MEDDREGGRARPSSVSKSGYFRGVGCFLELGFQVRLNSPACTVHRANVFALTLKQEERVNPRIPFTPLHHLV